MEIARRRRTHATHQGCPLGQVYVLETLHQRVVEEAHTSLASGHRSMMCTAVILALKYWWLGMIDLVRTMVQSCSVCMTTKSPCCLPASKLRPLPVPERPLSHIAVDFITDLRDSKGYTTVLVVVDWF